jgi:hypothetical protein
LVKDLYRKIIIFQQVENEYCKIGQYLHILCKYWLDSWIVLHYFFIKKCELTWNILAHLEASSLACRRDLKYFPEIFTPFDQQLVCKYLTSSAYLLFFFCKIIIFIFYCAKLPLNEKHLNVCNLNRAKNGTKVMPSIFLYYLFFIVFRFKSPIWFCKIKKDTLISGERQTHIVWCINNEFREWYILFAYDQKQCWI